ncbi:MAG: SCP2 sterol-binding domain-containing protein [Pseudomonadota bacterium]
MSEVDIRQFMHGMKTRFDSARAAGLTGTIQFIIDGDNGGDFLITIADQVCDVEERRAERPSLLLRMSRETYVDMALGKLKGPEAFFRRRLRYKGDMRLLLKMHQLFPSLKVSSLPKA